MPSTDAAKKPGLAVVICGPSGVGKTTIAKLLVERYGYMPSVSATTRAPRAGEVNGKDYFFLTRETFEDKLRRGEFLEHSEHFNNLYGTPAAPVRRAVEEGRTVLLEIDVNGAQQVKERLPKAFLIFLVAPDYEEMERRLRNRHSESDASIRTRLQRADMEIAASLRYDARVTNDHLEKAVETVHALIQKAEAGKHEG